jgi:hypothetical protein
MPKGNRKPSAPFVKNDPRINRKGPKVIDKVIKEIRLLAKEDMTLGFSEKLKWTVPQLREVIYGDNKQINENSTAFDIGICTAIMKWIQTGDFAYIQPYVEYIFGKPTQNIKAEGSLFATFTQQDKGL